MLELEEVDDEWPATTDRVERESGVLGIKYVDLAYFWSWFLDTWSSGTDAERTFFGNILEKRGRRRVFFGGSRQSRAEVGAPI